MWSPVSCSILLHVVFIVVQIFVQIILRVSVCYCSQCLPFLIPMSARGGEIRLPVYCPTIMPHGLSIILPIIVSAVGEAIINTLGVYSIR